jgi:hypothetical protein
MSKISYRSILKVGLIVFLGLIIAFISREGIIRDIIILVLSALLVGIVSSFISGKIFYDDGMIRASQGFAMFVITLFFASNFYRNNKLSSFNYTIYLEDKVGDSPLKNSKINFRYGTANNPYEIDSKGGMSIPSIPAQYKDGEAYIQLSSDGDWQFDNGTKKDTLKLSGEKTTLIIEPENSRCCLKGKVWFSDKKAHLLEGIIIQVEESSTKTDLDGHYVLPLPEKLRLEQRLRIEAFSKKYRGSIYGNTALNNDIRLELKR